MTAFKNKVRTALLSAGLLRPVIVSGHSCRTLAREINLYLVNSTLEETNRQNLVGCDVILVHSGDCGWDRALEHICRQCPARLIVISPELPRAEAFKMQWVADVILFDEETYTHEVHELGLSA